MSMVTVFDKPDLHEFVEAMCAIRKGTSFVEIDNWDLLSENGSPSFVCGSAVCGRGVADAESMIAVVF